jgi:rRNA processing protein Gar1
MTETRINEPVYNKKGDKIGSVFDIFGPVSSPYVSVRLLDGQEILNGKPIFFTEKKGKKKSRKKKKR